MLVRVSRQSNELDIPSLHRVAYYERLDADMARLAETAPGVRYVSPTSRCFAPSARASNMQMRACLCSPITAISPPAVRSLLPRSSGTRALSTNLVKELRPQMQFGIPSGQD
jgi:hypothetical protein